MREARIAERRSSSSLRDVVLAEEETAAGGMIEAAEQIQQRALARARRPHDRHVIALGHFEVDALEHRHRFLAELVILAEVLQPDRRPHRRRARTLACGGLGAAPAAFGHAGSGRSLRPSPSTAPLRKVDATFS